MFRVIISPILRSTRLY